MSILVKTLLISLALHPALLAETLYSTDFEDFPVGANKWAGFDGWVSNDSSSGAQAIDQDVIPAGGLGKTAAIGFNEPNSTFTSVFQNVSYDPSEGGHSLIEFQTLFGIEDSTSSFRDSFFFSFYNTDGDLLASIRLSNQESDYGIWRRDGNILNGGTESDTDLEFIRGELHNLNARIDLARNTWTATLDGITLFVDQTFNGTNKPLTLGPIAAEWLLSARFTQNHGDNWMLVADLVVETVEDPPLKIDSIVLSPDGTATLSWAGHQGYTYQVEYSDMLGSWKTDLPGSLFEDLASDQTLTFTDTSASSFPRRFYRLTRSGP